jgi:hypothetical protein
MDIQVVETTYQVTVVDDNAIVVEILNDNPIVIEVGIQGPPGKDGSSGAIVSETAPPNPTSGALWFNSLTQVLMVYSGGVWTNQILDGLYF